MPHLRELVKLHGTDDFELIGINVGDDEKAYKQGVADFGVTWTVAFDGHPESDIAKSYRVRSFPTILVLDREGRIRAKGLRGEKLIEFVSKLVAEADER